MHDHHFFNAKGRARRASSMKVERRRRKYVVPLVLTLFGITMRALSTIWWRTDTSTPQSVDAMALYNQHQKLTEGVVAQSAPDTQNRTLVIYVYHESDDVTKENLEFFLKVKIVEGGRSERTGRWE